MDITGLPARLKNVFLPWFQPYYAAVRPSFRHDGKSYPYFWHRYNMTCRGERCVEVPVVMDYLRAAGGKRVLEVGNVLSHYFPVRHDVVDKYEKGDGVKNVDIVDYKPAVPYDLIVSISTFEHVGWDETPRQPRKLLRAVDNLKAACLAKGGVAVVTMPLGYNPHVTDFVDAGELAFDESHCLLRRGRFNDWREASWAEVRHARYDDPYPFGNGLLIGVLRGR